MVGPMTLDAYTSRVLAQVVADGPVSAPALAAALADPWPAPDLERALLVLQQRHGMIRSVARVGARYPSRSARDHLYEPTDAGRIEASGGAQTCLLPRAPIPTQPALF